MRALASALALLLVAGPARAGLFGRGKVESRWTVKPLPVNGDDSDWNDSSAWEEDGLSVLAMNDADDLYLIVTAHTRDARDQLSGQARQDVALAFVGADGKSRDWGARLPFSRREALTSALRDPAGVDPEPELLAYAGPRVSTAAWPADMADRLAAVGRRPVWELKIPLKRLNVGPERTVLLDLALSDPAAGASRTAVPRAPKEKAPEGDAGGRHGRHHDEPADEGPLEPLRGAVYGLRLFLAPPPGSH